MLCTVDTHILLGPLGTNKSILQQPRIPIRIIEKKLYVKMTDTVKQCLELKSCSYHTWYEKFSKVAFESICLPIPANVLKYILDDLFVLPKECNVTATDAATTSPQDKEWDDDNEEFEIEVRFSFTFFFNHKKFNRIQIIVMQ